MRRRREIRQKTASPPRRKFRRSEWIRESSTKRGYGSRWQKHRAAFLAEFPFCIVCITVKADLVDHIIPVQQGDGELSGAEDPLFWEVWNHQPLCRQHHAIKTIGHDQRIGGSRVWLLNQLTEDETDLRRNQLITLAELWDQWVELGTGNILRLDLQTRQ